MRDIWLISDTHFCHENFLNFTDKDGNKIRKFDSVSHMNEHMVECWNSVVKPGDKVYHLGDVYMGDTEVFKILWPRLNGSKNLIVGNHDRIKFFASGSFFKNIYMWRRLDNLLLTHVPVHESVLGEARFSSLTNPKPKIKNIHGHIHHNPSPTKNHICVCVEQINYTPVNIEELL
ncbi:MAG: hypothetical protein KDH96_08310 [Candidatus Riesia sp.]|nr:hypothetical protein [Candidatus Riesia sp.]